MRGRPELLAAIGILARPRDSRPLRRLLCRWALFRQRYCSKLPSISMSILMSNTALLLARSMTGGVIAAIDFGGVASSRFRCRRHGAAIYHVISILSIGASLVFSAYQG